MTRIRRTSALALAAALLAGSSALAGCGSDGSSSSQASAAGGSSSSSSKAVIVRIARTGYFDPLAIAQGNGSLTKAVAAAGGKASYTAPFGAFAPVAQALNSGAVDIGVGSITSAIGGLVGKSGYTIFAAQAPNTVEEGVVVPKSSSARTVADLVGKEVAVNKAGTGEYLLRKALAAKGIAPSKVKIKYLPPPQAAPAFATGKLDGWATWGNFSDTARAVNGGRYVATGPEVGSQNSVILVVRNEFLQEHPAIVKAIYEAGRAESVRDQADPETATKTGNATAKLPAPVAAEQVKAFAASQPLTPVDASVKQSFQEVATFFHDQGVIPAVTDIDKHVVDVSTLQGGQ